MGNPINGLRWRTICCNMGDKAFIATSVKTDFDLYHSGKNLKVIFYEHIAKAR